jgi:hypothetical protein
MCGRFTNRLTWREIVALSRLAVPATPERNLPASYNICPTDAIDVVIERGANALGLIPSWWMKTAKEVPATFNARAETLAVKPMFRFRRNTTVRSDVGTIAQASELLPSGKPGGDSYACDFDSSALGRRRVCT